MADRELDDLTALLPPLLNALEALAFVSRYFYPPAFADLMSAIGAPEDGLRAARGELGDWPQALQDIRTAVDTASELTLGAFDELRAVQREGGDARGIYRALRNLPRAQEALYPLASGIPPVNRYFLEPGARDDKGLQQSLLDAPADENVGVMHLGGPPGARGAFSLYVPEYYTSDRMWPLVMAMHGGSGNGRAFLWSWLRDARSHGAIVIAPTATGDTWALFDEDEDTPNLARILEFACGRWNIDTSRLLLTGMSDGGTFTYASGLDSSSLFTHLAPIAASFHPLLAQMADRERLRGLPIHIAHGALDWMFEIDLARRAQESLSAAGANVTYCELEDLSHCYPRELNPKILEWLNRA